MKVSKRHLWLPVLLVCCACDPYHRMRLVSTVARGNQPLQGAWVVPLGFERESTTTDREGRAKIEYANPSPSRVVDAPVLVYMRGRRPRLLVPGEPGFDRSPDFWDSLQFEGRLEVDLAVAPRGPTLECDATYRCSVALPSAGNDCSGYWIVIEPKAHVPVRAIEAAAAPIARDGGASISLLVPSEISHEADLMLVASCETQQQSLVSNALVLPARSPEQHAAIALEALRGGTPEQRKGAVIEANVLAYASDEHLRALVAVSATEPDVGVRTAVWKALGGHVENADRRPTVLATVPDAARAAVSRTMEERTAGLAFLAQVGRHSDALLPYLSVWIDSEAQAKHSPLMLAELCTLIESMAERAAPLVPQMLAALDRLQAMSTALGDPLCWTLGALGPAAPLERLIQEVTAGRTCGPRALRRIGPRAVAAAPALITALDGTGSDADAVQMRSLSADALGQIGPTARAAIPALRRAAGDRAFEVRRSALYALSQLAYDDANARLIGAALTDPVGDVRSAAYDALAQMKGAGKAAIPALLDRLASDEVWRWREEAARTLGKVGMGSAAAKAGLTRSADDDEDELVCAAARAALAALDALDASSATAKRRSREAAGPRSPR